jgi:hypothetical protein
MNKWLTGGASGHGSVEKQGPEKDGYDLASTSDNSEGAAEGGEPPDSSVAFSIWLGILIDGVPESMLIGFMQSEGSMPALSSLNESFSTTSRSLYSMIDEWRMYLYVTFP